MRWDALGWVALVRGRFAARAAEAEDPPYWFGASESARWSRLITRKRREEFLSGRLAAKLALNATRIAGGARPLSYATLDVSATVSGAPRCSAERAALSISHSGGTAVALASRTSAAVGIDVEASVGRRWPLADMFHAVELVNIRDVADARWRWTVKEAWSKLAGTGLVGLAQPPFVVGAAGLWWLVVPRASADHRAAWVAVRRFRGIPLAVAVARHAGLMERWRTGGHRGTGS